MIGTLFKILRQLREIRRRSTTLDRRGLARAYLKIQIKYHLLAKRLRVRIRREKVLGLRVRFFDYATFAFLFEEIFVNEQYRFTARRPDPLVVDGGANVGVASLYFKSVYPRARVLAFEPDARTALILRRNLDRNGVEGVQVVNAALSDRAGTTHLYYDPGTPGSVLMTTRPGVFRESAPVPTVRLSDSLDGPVDFLKLDVEGAEAVVLGELAESGKLALVREMAVEYNHHHAEPDTDRLAAVLALLEQNGFGYMLSAPYPPPLGARRPQNVLIYAYRKDDPPPG